MEKINIGLIGCGGIADSHVEGFRILSTRGLKVFDVKTVCDVFSKV